MFSSGSQSRSITICRPYNDKKANTPLASRVRQHNSKCLAGNQSSFRNGLNSRHQSYSMRVPRRAGEYVRAASSDTVLLSRATKKRSQLESNLNTESQSTRDPTSSGFKIIDSILEIRRKKQHSPTSTNSTDNNEWFPNLKNSLQRSLSLRQFERGQTKKGASSWTDQCLNGKERFSDTKRRLRNDIANQRGKYDSLMNSARKVTIALFILLPLAFVSPAPIPPPLVRPIWLHDGLISLDPNYLDSDLESDSIDTRVQQLTPIDVTSQYDNSYFRPVLESDEQRQQTYPIPESASLSLQSIEARQQNNYGGKRDRSDHSGQVDDWLQYNDHVTTAGPASQPRNEDFLWIQRRRLDRDRAHEPPPWLREQPMRRGFNVGPQYEELMGDEQLASNNSPSLTVVRQNKYQSPSRQLIGDEWLKPRSARGRQSRQPSREVYEEILKHLVEQSIDGHALLDDLKNEIELRSAASQRPASKSVASLKSAPGKIVPSIDSEMIQLESAGAMNPHRKDDHQAEVLSVNPFGVVQEADQDSTLVVVGDEVSSADDVTSLESSTNPRSTSNMAYFRPLLASIDGGDKSGKLVLEPLESTVAPSKSVPELVPSAEIERDATNSDYGFYVSSPEVTNVDRPNSELSMESDDRRLDRLRELQGFPVMSSFHVIEDIDQVDNAQDSSMVQLPSLHENGDQPLSEYQQQQRIPETSEKLEQALRVNEAENSAPGAGLMAARAFSGQPMKRSAAVLSHRARYPAEQLAQLDAYAGREPSRSYASQAGNNFRDQDLVTMIKSGQLTWEQLAQVATKLKTYLEDYLQLPQFSILGLYPMNAEQLLIKLDTSKFTSPEAASILHNYDFARGFILVGWPKGRGDSPIPVLLATLRHMAQMSGVAEDDKETEDNQESVALSELDSLAVGQRPSTTSVVDQLAALIGSAPVEFLQQQQQQPRLANYQRFGSVSPAWRWPIAAPYGNNALPLSLGVEDYSVEDVGYLGPEERAAALVSVARSSLQPLVLVNELNSLAAENDGQKNGLLSSLASYLNTFYADSGDRLIAQSALATPTAAARTNGRADGNSHLWVRAIALIVALMGALVAVKLLMMRGSIKKDEFERRRLRNYEGSLRSLWSTGSRAPSYASATESSIVEGAADKQVKLEAGNFVCQESCEDLEAGELSSRQKLDLLAHKLYNFLGGGGGGGEHEVLDDSTAEKSFEKGAEKPQEGGLELADELVVADGDAEGQPARFRTSRSYIKSLIDVLSKARSQLPMSFSGNAGGASETLAGGAALEPNIIGDGLLAAEQQEDAGILVSQMDISAAHLILAYMEKHLEDKERLEREWLELNANVSGFTPTTGPGNKAAISAASNSVKISQLMVQRLAKVALSEENRKRNRNLMVVPFDRNRVKLGSLQASSGSVGSIAGASTGSGAPTATTTGHSSKRRQSSASDKLAANSANDYINASFIYDDDPRQPTHIIAEGPSEQTCGQFWQMVWEQGISVIVMLTRLNENSTQMCHCYWPTSDAGRATDKPANGAQWASSSKQQSPTSAAVLADLAAMPTVPGNGSSSAAAAAAAASSPSPSFSASLSTGSAAAQATAAPVQQPQQSPLTNANGRRGSVTSVFNKLAGRQSGGALAVGQPIISANGDSCNNVLAFDIDYHHQQQQQQGEHSVEQSADCLGANQQRSKSPPLASNAANGPTRIEVHLVSEHVSSNDYLVRNMYLINRSTGETRTITQFHYLAWPEAGVPENAKSLLQFRRKVHKSYRNLKSPILVHCSDGAGRSGTYTLIDIILERIRKGAKEIDPRATLEHLRDQRIGLCATQSQFEFVLVALAEEIQIILNALPH